MLRNANSESEILLGNTQLIGIFFLLAVLLGVAFTAGFMLGHGSFGKKAEPLVAGAAAAPVDSGQRTAVVEPPPTPATGTESTAATEPAASTAAPVAKPAPVEKTAEDVPKPSKKSPAIEEPASKPRTGQNEPFTPQPGQTFLQVAAELHDSAASAASVLNKSGFNAHVVLAPGGKLFRVIVGPVKDKNDLAATRDALKAKGFLTVIVRNY
jgi:cell division septation protein DedD